MAAEDAEGRKTLAGYMLRAPMSVQKMTYDAASGTVIYRSKMHAGLKRDFQVRRSMPRVAPACQLATGLSPGARHRLNCRTEETPPKQPGCGK